MTTAEVDGLLISATSLVMAALATLVAVSALRRADRNSSAATVVALSEALRQAWARFLFDAPDEHRRGFEFADLCNTLELSCAILENGGLHGKLLRLVQETIQHQLKLIDEDEGASARLASLRDRPDTFEHLTRFLAKRRIIVSLRS